MAINHSNSYGSDIGNTENDGRFIERDYSIGGGVTMYSDYEHGFTHERVIEQDKKNFFGKGPRNWTRSDQRIKEDVCEELYDSPYVDASDIEVQVDNGIVTLKGWVNTREEKIEAVHCIEGLIGVKEIRNELMMRNR